MLKKVLLTATLSTVTTFTVQAKTQFKFLKAGEIMPKGWIKQQMATDLNKGFYGSYDKVNHSVTHNLFTNKDRFSDKRYQTLKCWWSGEHEGYWKDGILRMAFLSGDKKFQKRALKWADEILESTGLDGYIGIYHKGDTANSRFSHKGENGELWTQSRIFQFLLGAYEFSGDERYFKAVKKATDLTIKNFNGSYFNSKQAHGGVSHAVGFFDTLFYLYNKTGEQKYADFILVLHKDFNTSNVRDYDLKTDRLLKKRKFHKHGAHVAEGFFMPWLYDSLANDENAKMAAKNALEILKFHLVPSGAMAASESVTPGRPSAAYEYCGISEMVPSLTKVIALSGDLSIADMIEKMTFNSGQAGRTPDLKGLSYLTTDNRLHIHDSHHGGRLAYAAFHNAAACCTLNAGRLMPYYVEGMWMKGSKEQGLTAMLYGPSVVKTKINGRKVKVIAETVYPFSNKIKIKVHPSKKGRFPLSFRIPKHSENLKFKGIKLSQISQSENIATINKFWKKGDTFTVTFNNKSEVKKHHIGNEYYLQNGPLVYALKFPEEMTERKNLSNSGFFVYHTKPLKKEGWDYRLDPKAQFKLVKNSKFDALNPWEFPAFSLAGKLVDKEGKKVPVKLQPIGSTVLRRVSFPAAK